MKKILTIGEAIIDFIPDVNGKGLESVENFAKKAGGAPANVAAGVAKLGGKSAFISQVGEDGFGKFLISELNKYGVDTTQVKQSPDYDTSLAFVSLDEQGDRDFIFYRSHAADLNLDLSKEDIEKLDCDIIHFCSVSLVDSKMKESHIRLLEWARQNDKTISFDPNLRLNLWQNDEECIKTVNEFIKYADILKISDNELELIFGESDPAVVAKKLIDNGLSYFVYTKGADGSEVYYKDECITAKGNKVKAVDTTGAGDSFIASFLYKFATMDQKDEITLKEALEFANKFAAITTTRPGAVEAMPTIEEM